MDKKSLKKLLKKINGVILPGGFGNYQPAARVIVRYSRKLSKKNILFPVLGICLGAQILMKIETNEPIIKPTDAHNVPLPLKFVTRPREEWKESQLFRNAPLSLIQVLKTKQLTYNAHLNGVLLSDFTRRESLKKRFRVITTNEDIEGKTFISTFEGQSLQVSTR